MPTHTNALANETSPYLLQHAHNPVNWQPWGKEALAQAKKEDKPMIVSIGYAACHWCHVMEHESFEDSAVAAVMNEHFICIKVDREERPDVDQIYMDAVQAMGQQGGWPLNVFLTSDAKPFYGGTYFPPANWIKICTNVAQAYHQERDKIEQSATQITNGITSSVLDQFKPKETHSFNSNTLTTAFLALEKDFDHRHGGFGGAPKFPMPCNLSFMMRYYNRNNQESALAMTTKTLDEMAYGGIYDQVGGGFARYSTDARWFAPHFEKMLYDNGQLISNYAQAYRFTKKGLYKDVIYQTVSFVERELMSPEGGFYSSLDADSEGVEGKFYCWEEEELQRLLNTDFTLFKTYYNTSVHGNWEEKNILYRTSSDEEFAEKNELTIALLQQKVAHWQQALMKIREHRIRPGLDDKILASWNGWMLNGLCDAYRSFSDERFLSLALKNATFISENMISKGKVFHNHKNGVTTLDGYLEDYAALIKAFINLYQVTFDEKWLHLAKALTDYTIVHFYDEKEKLFFFTDDQSEALIARKKEIFDNVIPASNSVMAENLHFLGLYFDHKAYTQKSDAMLQQVLPLIERNARYTTFWASVYRLKVAPTIEIAISGSNYQSIRADFQQREVGNAIFMGRGENDVSSLPLLAEKQSSGETLIYICYNKTCQFPVKEIDRAIEQIK